MKKVNKADNLYTSLLLIIYTVIYITRIYNKYNIYINLNISTDVLVNNLYIDRLYDRCFHM